MKEKNLFQRFRAWQKDPFPLDKVGESHVCVGCGKEYLGEYCPSCGQHCSYGRASWLSLLKEVIVLGGLSEPQSTLSFLAQLFGRPGYLIGDYISGRRYVCASPLGMLGVIAVATMLVDKLTTNVHTDWVLALAEGGDLLGTIMGWLADNLNWAILIQTLLLILPTWLLFRHAPRHPRHTLPDGIYIQMFMGSLVLICVMLRALSSNVVLALIPIFYYIAYKQLFGYGVWGTLWRTFLCLGIIMYFFAVIMMVPSHLSENFWNGVSLWGFLSMVFLFVALGAGMLVLGWWIGKRTEQKRMKGEAVA